MIAVENLSVRQGTFALNGIGFTVPTGAYAVLMGRTGCGKTTLLESLAGLRPIAAGRIVLADRDVTQLPPAARTVGYVPQDAAVFRTMTVRENLAFALTVRKAANADKRVAELASWLGLSAILDRRAIGLSGGEAQRVALGRALAFEPSVLLLDEPLNAIDDETREQLVALLETVKRSQQVTVLHVTHSQCEAKRLADVVLKLENGNVISGDANGVPRSGQRSDR